MEGDWGAKREGAAGREAGGGEQARAGERAGVRGWGMGVGVEGAEGEGGRGEEGTAWLKEAEGQGEGTGAHRLGGLRCQHQEWEEGTAARLRGRGMVEGQGEEVKRQAGVGVEEGVTGVGEGEGGSWVGEGEARGGGPRCRVG